MELDWKKLLKMAYLKAQESRNPSTQNGAILVGDDGAILIEVSNTLVPDGLQEIDERKAKPLRHKFSVHAERNAIYKAAKSGVKIQGLTMVCCWAVCSECAQGLIQAGIKRLVTHTQALEKSNNWTEEIELGFAMLREAGVEIIMYDGKIGGVKILRSGEHWEP